MTDADPTDGAPAFSLFETMGYTPSAGFPAGFARLDRHLDRLAASARALGFADPTAAAVAALRAEALRLAGEPQRWRVRLVANRAGQVQVTGVLLPADASRVRTAALARTPVDRNDLFLHHKTTHRAVYDTRRAERAHVDDVLLWNEEGELTEFTIGSLVVERDGRRWTPPLTSGLLPGVFRAELLERELVAERVLRARDLAGARVWLVNSLRAWVAIEMLAAA